jgi:hypothetical protein
MLEIRDQIFEFFFKYPKKADLTVGALQPGNLMFVGIKPVTSLPQDWEFSVVKCTISDAAIGQSFDILDSCPIEGTSFIFKNGQTDKSSVNFSFRSFIFSASANDAVLDISCDAHVC